MVAMERKMKSFRFAQFYGALSLAGLLLIGCVDKRKQPEPSVAHFIRIPEKAEPEVKTEAPDLTSNLSGLEKDIQVLKEDHEFTRRYDEVTIEAYRVIADCKNVEPEEWDAQKCDARKKALPKKKAAIDKEYDAWKAVNP